MLAEMMFTTGLLCTDESPSSHIAMQRKSADSGLYYPPGASVQGGRQTVKPSALIHQDSPGLNKKLPSPLPCKHPPTLIHQHPSANPGGKQGWLGWVRGSPSRAEEQSQNCRERIMCFEMRGNVDCIGADMQGGGGGWLGEET